MARSSRPACVFGVLIFFVGLLDAVDSALARTMNCASKFGAYLDAICDRLFDAAAVFALAWVSHEWFLCFLLVTGGLLVSYAKARATMEINVSNNEWPDLMERTERGIVFAIGVVLWGAFKETSFFGINILVWMLVLLNLTVYFTLIQRILRARQYLKIRS